MAGIIAFCTVPSKRSGVGGSKLQLGRLGVANCRRLRSAAAANKLDAEGFENIACITTGLQTVNPGTFDSVGSTELQNAGKAGLVTVQGKISAVLGLFFGLSFTKPNPEFVQSVKKQFSADSKILLVCQEGLRSAAAANKLDAEGFENIACITSGLQTVSPGTFDSVGSTELQNAGKAGLVTVQGKISAVLGTILICAYLFITLFPDQAEKILQLIPAN